MPGSRTALVAGATGLVGRALAQVLLEGDAYGRIVTLARSERVQHDARHRPLVVDYDRLPALALPMDGADVFCALGTTMKVAGSREAFRRVDFTYVVRLAAVAATGGARSFSLVSALGADPTSRIFYNRVKGEMEQAVAALGFDSVLIARPSLLAGDRSALGQPPRTAERLALWLSTPFAGLIPAGVRPIKADVVARAMIQGMRQPPAGVRIIESGELQELGAE